MVKYYLGEPVELLEELGDGWCWARWTTGKHAGKVYKHWRTQLEDTPWGR